MPELIDTRGHASPYRAEYDARSHIVQALLPDGDYTLRVSAFGPSKPIVNSSGGIVTEVKNFLFRPGRCHRRRPRRYQPAHRDGTG